MTHDPDVTRLLVDLSSGNREAADRLFPLVYGELLRLARERLRHERDGHSLATVDLVHEAYLRLVDGATVGWQDRAHFFAVASSVMRRLLVDWARARRAAKRGGDRQPLSLDAAPGGGPDGAGAVLLDSVAAPVRDETLLELDEALTRLAVRSDRQARVVECRYFGGLTIEETAEALDVSPSTVKDDWRLARAWLYREIQSA
ncbi:MAG TPA: ECF-type sigma factor [Rubricoccaceae bacterium]